MKTFARRVISSLVVLTVLAAAATAADAPPTAAVAGPPTDPKTAPPAAWVKPGMRLTFATTHGVYYYAANQLTPARPGDQGLLSFRDPDHPTKFWTVHAFKSTATASLTEAQVVAVADGKVYVAHTNWEVTNLRNPNGDLVPTGGSAARVYPAGTIGTDYISPAFLRAQPDDKAADHQVWRATATVDGRQVPTINAVTQGKSTVLSQIFDLETGIALSTTSAYQSPDPGAPDVGLGPQGARVLHTSRFKGLRAVQYPWVGKPAPDWARTVKSISVRVEVTVNSDVGDRLHGPIVTTEDVKLHVVDRGADWLAVARFAPGQSPGPGVEPVADSMRFAGSALGPGSIFLPPAGLADLKLGQVVDTDPASKCVTTVTTLERRGNVDVVGFTETWPGVRVQSFYNRATGALLSLQADLPQIGGSRHLKETTIAVE